MTFIEALSAVPEATRALASARQALQGAWARQAAVQSAAGAARMALDSATGTVHETAVVLALADFALSGSQDDIDDAARTMYTSGGTAPSLVDVLLTADSELGLARSLVMRQYLVSAGDRAVLDHDQADEARRRAAGAADAAIVQRDLAAAATVTADTDVAAAANDVTVTQAVVAGALTRYRELRRLTRVDRSADYGRIRTCGDWLTRLLSRTGFEGEDLREAWAIVMRESGGRADSVSATGDLGLFQINTKTWQGEDWFDRDLLLKRRYNSQVAYQLSRAGRTWYSWGLDGHGRPSPGAYVKAGWSDDRITSAIVVPYIQWYALYPCRPAYEKDLAGQVPELPPGLVYDAAGRIVALPELQHGVGPRLPAA
jgi:hypothetical protein